MDETSRELSLRNQIAKNSGMSFICVPCWMVFSHQNYLYSHFKIQEKTDTIHRGFAQRESNFSMFLQSYQNAMAWENITAEELPIQFSDVGRRNFSFCFALESVLKKKGPHKSNSPSEMLSLLKELMEKEKKSHVCPVCWLLFNWRPLREHCEKIGDDVHKGLMMKDREQFLPWYYQAIGKEVPANDLPLGQGRKGAHSFQECFKLDLVIRIKICEYCIQENSK